ncbi:MAG: FecR domain-containing protein [Bacteroidota bacterium]
MDKKSTLYIALRQLQDSGRFEVSLSREEEKLVRQLQEAGLVKEALQIMDSTDLESSWAILRNRVKIGKEKSTSGQVLPFRKRVLRYAALFIGILMVSSVIYYGIQSTAPIDGDSELGTDQIILTQADGSKKVLSEESASEVRLSDKKGNAHGVQRGKVLDYSAVSDTNKEKNLVYNELTVPLGKTFDLILSDGSHVSLNSGTHIRYPVAFSDKGKREVVMTGEAYFKVEKDSIRPFNVAFKDGFTIEVLGTEFNVSTHAEGVDVQTVLVEGSVALSGNGPQGKRFLTPGHKAEWDKTKGSIAISPANLRLYTGWLKGELIFRNARFQDIIANLERSYNVVIQYNREAFVQKRYDASFHVDVETIEEVMYHLSRITPIDFRIAGREITINTKE